MNKLQFNRISIEMELRDKDRKIPTFNISREQKRKGLIH